LVKALRSASKRIRGLHSKDDNYVEEKLELDQADENLIFELMLEEVTMKLGEKKEEPLSANKTFMIHYGRAQKGFAESLFVTGACYHYGIEPDLETNFLLAQKYYLKAALAGDYRAVNNLAVMSYNGDGMEKNEERTIDLLELASRYGIYNARMNLAVMRILPHDPLLKDYAEAFKILTILNESDELSTGQVKNNLALAYARGFGVKSDGAKAMDLLKRSHAENCRVATYNIGVMCYNGFAGVAKNENEGLKWMNEAKSDVNHADYSCISSASDTSKLLMFTTINPCY